MVVHTKFRQFYQNTTSLKFSLETVEDCFHWKYTLYFPGLQLAWTAKSGGYFQPLSIFQNFIAVSKTREHGHLLFGLFSLILLISIHRKKIEMWKTKGRFFQHHWRLWNKSRRFHDLGRVAEFCSVKAVYSAFNLRSLPCSHYYGHQEA